MELLKSLLATMHRRPRRPAPDPAGARLNAPRRPPLLYAVGDVHGCLEALLELEHRILADAREVAGEKWIVHLGDYIDRGPRSAQVIDHLLAAPPAGFQRICLRGNHEAMMLAALADPANIEPWLALGGDRTMQSYGVSAAQIEALSRRSRAPTALQALRAHVPDEHVTFLHELATVLSVPGYIFVHAGLRPGIALLAQAEADMLWIRDEFIGAAHDFGAVVVHGHTPVQEPFASAHRICIDTGCFMTGRLTALRVDAGGGVRFVQSGHALTGPGG
jgi:serine/threonine protein phosphatase 1